MLCRTELSKAWPHYSTEHVDEEIWWYTLDKQDPQSVTLEPEGVVQPYSHLAHVMHQCLGYIVVSQKASDCIICIHTLPQAI